MIEVIGNLFDFVNIADAICITTNGIVKSNQEAVMGAGIALQAAEKFPLLPKRLGGFLLKFNENKPYILGAINDNTFYIPKKEDVGKKGCMIFSFPTKNHFSEKSNIKLIETSAINLLNYVNKYNLKYICLPKVGCGLGGLDWHNDIKPLLINIFDDRFKILNI